MLGKPSRGMAIENLKYLQKNISWGINFNIDITWTQDKVKVTILKKLPQIQILEFKKKTKHMTHLLNLLEKMYKYEMDPLSIVEVTEWTQFYGRPFTPNQKSIHVTILTRYNSNVIES